MKTNFPIAEDLLNFELTIAPDEGQSALVPRLPPALERPTLPPSLLCCDDGAVADSAARLTTGMYKGGTFKFTVNINNNYPHEPPKVKCVPKVRLALTHPGAYLPSSVRD